MFSALFGTLPDGLGLRPCARRINGKHDGLPAVQSHPHDQAIAFPGSRSEDCDAVAVVARFGRHPGPAENPGSRMRVPVEANRPRISFQAFQSFAYFGVC